MRVGAREAAALDRRLDLKRGMPKSPKTCLDPDPGKGCRSVLGLSWEELPESVTDCGVRGPHSLAPLAATRPVGVTCGRPGATCMTLETSDPVAAAARTQSSFRLTRL